VRKEKKKGEGGRRGAKRGGRSFFGPRRGEKRGERKKNTPQVPGGRQLRLVSENRCEEGKKKEGMREPRRKGKGGGLGQDINVVW